MDDSAAIRQAALSLLQMHGIRALALASADDFIAHLADGQRERPCCLILDLEMPGTNGAELLERMAADGTRVPTVVITGSPNSALAYRAWAAGFRKVLSKPFGAEELLDAIAEVLGPSGPG